MAKKIGAVGNKVSDDVVVESLKNLSNKQAVNAIGEHFAAVSNEYAPIDNTKLLAYLPAQSPPQIDEITVYRILCELKRPNHLYPLISQKNYGKNVLYIWRLL